MKSLYISPIVKITVLSFEDILIGSDTFVDVGSLWNENEQE